MVSVSVIVPTKNEATNLPHLLASLPAEVELVVCDASTEGTASVAVTLRPDRTLVVDGPGTVAEARQRGAQASSGNILVFTDADVEFDAGYFDRLQLLRHWDGVCGAKLSRDLYASDYQLMLRAQNVTYRWLGIAAASGSNMVMTRPAFEAAGGFRTQLNCNENTELFMRAGRRGLRMHFDERLVVWARDHRRLQRGRRVKATHSLVRNVLLYFVCCQPRLPRVLLHDWGYWARTQGQGIQ